MKPRYLYFLAAVLVFNLSLLAASALLGLQSTKRYPPIGQFVSVNGVRLHLLDSALHSDLQLDTTGDTAPALVLLHGASTSLRDFEPTLRPRLLNYGRIISIDRPGHGYSDRGNQLLLDDQWTDPARQATLINQALQQLGVTEAIWIGHSWAGSVVLAALLDSTSSAVAGVLIAGATHPWKSEPAWHTKTATLPGIGAVFSWQYIATLGRLALPSAVAAVFHPEDVPDNYLTDTGLYLSTRPWTFRNNAQDLTRLSDYLSGQYPRYRDLTQPILSITGEHDHVVPAWNHDLRLRAQLPQIESVQIAGAGHVPHHTQADVIASLILEFAASLKAQTSLP